MSKRRTMTPKQRQAKIEAAKKSEEAAARSKARGERRKKIVTVIVCIILVLGLGIPTVSLTVCSQMRQDNTANSEEAAA